MKLLLHWLLFFILLGFYWAGVAENVPVTKDAPAQVISLNFQNIPVRSLLQVIAGFAHMNIVSSDAVRGNMSIYLERVSWQQALSVVLQSQNLSERQIAGAWYIAPLTANPLKTAYFKIYYADARQVESLIRHAFPDINLSLDPRSNTLMLKANQSQLDQISALLKKIDMPTRQILIEARIAVIDESALKELGVILNGASDNGLLQRLPAASGTSINLPVENPAGTIGFQIGHLPNGQSIDLQLQALEAQGQGEIISSPKLLVSDNQKAYIEQGEEIPFQTSTSSGATQIEFKKAVLGLEVTPHISKAQILLSLQVNDDAISNNESPAGQVPIVATSKLKTNVLVKNGETVVLGGIHIEEVKHDKRGVPVLDKIPAIGWLFRHTSDVNRKTELVVFITPTILE